MLFYFELIPIYTRVVTKVRGQIAIIFLLFLIHSIKIDIFYSESWKLGIKKIIVCHAMVLYAMLCYPTLWDFNTTPSTNRKFPKKSSKYQNFKVYHLTAMTFVRKEIITINLKLWCMICSDIPWYAMVYYDEWKSNDMLWYQIQMIWYAI